MAQLRDVTAAGAALRPVVESIRDATADSQAKLEALQAFFDQHPGLKDTRGLQRLVDENRRLAAANRQLAEEKQELLDSKKELSNELFSRQQLHNSAVAALREHQRTPVDKKVAALQEQVRMLRQQLHARDAALTKSEDENKDMRDKLGLPHRSLEECRTGSDLSPCKAEGGRFSSRSASPDVSRQLWADADEDDDGMHSSTCSIASGSISPDLQQRQQRQQQQQHSRLREEAERLKAALAAKDEQLLLLQQQVEQLEQEANLAPARAVSPAPPVIHHQKPKTFTEALQQLEVLHQAVANHQQQLLDQNQKAAQRAQDAHQAFNRQLQTEKVQLKVAVLEQQLGESHAKQDRLQLANAQLQERLSAMQLNRPSAEQDVLQQRMQQQADHVQRLQQQLQQERASVQDLQAQLQQQQQQQQQPQQSQLQQQLQDKQQQLDKQQQAVQQLQRQLRQQQQQVEGLEQQLQQKEQQLADTQQQLEQQQQQQQQQDVPQQVQQLQDELEDRTRELLEWQIHADALEKDLADLKARADSADALQQQLERANQQLAAHGGEVEALQQELGQCRERIATLEFDLHDAAKDHSALLQRFEGVTAELGRVREGAADMRLRLDHFTGPAGPQARIRQLEGSLQTVQRKYEGAESRATAAADEVQRKYEGAESRATAAAAEVRQLTTKLSNAEDEILALEGQISIPEQELAKYAS
ncbi:hypothetical protein OEZ86_000769 [Tetradesmus obliquus]|nr:hypothetical protein OEZ86_000769 [Tetradesmus obliquus]